MILFKIPHNLALTQNKMCILPISYPVGMENNSKNGRMHAASRIILEIRLTDFFENTIILSEINRGETGMLMLKELRKKAGLSVRALSELCGLSRRTIEDIEARGDCRISTAYVICKALGCSLDAFYKEEVGDCVPPQFVRTVQKESLSRKY